MSDIEIKKHSRIAERIAEKLTNSDSWVLNRVSNSLKRDKKYPLRFLIKKGILFLFGMLISRFYLRKCDYFGKHPRVVKKPYLINLGKIHIGDNVNINSRSVQCDLVSYPGGSLEIGNDVFVNFGTTICAQNNVRIGNNVKIGPYCMIHDTDFHIPGKNFDTAEGLPIIIEDDVWLSSRVLVMKGSFIGEGAIIAAGSVVSGFIPPNVVAGGVPAKIIKPREADDLKIPKSTKLSPKLKNEVDALSTQVSGIDLGSIPLGTTISSIPGCTAQNLMRIIEALEKHYSIKVQNQNITRLNSPLNIYNWVHYAMSDSKTFKKLA